MIYCIFSDIGLQKTAILYVLRLHSALPNVPWGHYRTFLRQKGYISEKTIK
jgi:hypothetical protein